MQTPRYILLTIMAVACVVLPISIFRSRRRVFETWAKTASGLACAFGLLWAGIAFTLIHFGDAFSGPIGDALTRARMIVGGICIGVMLAILLARPYKKLPP